jgi:ketosteroid isomerase-like protein
VNESSKQLIRGYFKAVNEERWEDVMALYRPDAVLNIPGRPPKVGHDRIRPFYEDLGQRYEKHTAELRLLLAEDNIAAATVEYEDRNADGREVSLFACDNFVFEDGLINELRIAFDSARAALCDSPELGTPDKLTFGSAGRTSEMGATRRKLHAGVKTEAAQCHGVPGVQVVPGRMPQKLR